MQNPGSPGPNDTRNIIIAVVLSGLILLGFEFFYNAPLRSRLAQERAQAEEQLTPQTSQTGETPSAASAPPATREEALSSTSTARIAIDTGSVDGSISLVGARLDDLNLRGYRRTVDPESPEVTVLSPMSANFGHDAFFGWELQSGQDVATLADAASVWSADAASRLTPETPVTLTLDAGSGVTIERTISVDQNYMFTTTDVVRNTSGAPLSVRALGVVRRQGLPENYVFNQIVHQGMIGTFGGQTRQLTYRDADKHARDRVRERVGADERAQNWQGDGAWLGVTDHYWLTAIVPPADESVSAYYDARAESGSNDYRAAYRGEWHEVPAGGEFTYTQRLFAGAKRYELLRDYQRGDGTAAAPPIARFDWAIDWGNFWFLTRPFFQWLLHPLGQLFSGWGIIFNFGLAIIASTVIIKTLMLPLVIQSFKMTAKMRTLQPKMKEIQERYAADKQRQQQEMLKLYQTEKLNPLAGCIPILLQIPVFYALYKTLSVTIEMRHEPFIGWINDLSARDPTSVFNLFGLLPYDVPSFLLIGAWPLLYGISMWALQSLSPPITDPVQAQIFRFLPVVFTVMFAAFPAGLVIYWTWSNIVTMLQQYTIMRFQGVETQLDTFIAKRLRKGEKPAGSG